MKQRLCRLEAPLNGQVQWPRTAGMDMGEVQVRPVKATFGVWLFLAPCLVASSRCPWPQRLRAKRAVRPSGGGLEQDRGPRVWCHGRLHALHDVYYETCTRDEPYRSSEDTQRNSTLHPEEDWMVSWRYPQPLAPMWTSMQANGVGNDSAGAYRFNLSAEHRMTFCVTFYGALDEKNRSRRSRCLPDDHQTVPRYEQAYSNAHSSYGWWDDIDVSCRSGARTAAVRFPWVGPPTVTSTRTKPSTRVVQPGRQGR